MNITSDGQHIRMGTNPYLEGLVTIQEDTFCDLCLVSLAQGEQAYRTFFNRLWCLPCQEDPDPYRHQLFEGEG